MLEKMFGEFQERNKFEDAEEMKAAAEKVIEYAREMERLHANSLNPYLAGPTIKAVRDMINAIDDKVSAENRMAKMIDKAHDQAIKEDNSGIHNN